jgi:hypothetical protein
VAEIVTGHILRVAWNHHRLQVSPHLEVSGVAARSPAVSNTHKGTCRYLILVGQRVISEAQDLRAEADHEHSRRCKGLMSSNSRFSKPLKDCRSVHLQVSPVWG